jgi:hypothetical protein
MDRLARYLSDGVESVEGWLHPVSAAFIGSIAAFQQQQGWTGSSGEIGVHHGKLFLVLHLAGDLDKPSFAIDLFEDQHLNDDLSGKGDYLQFMRNVEKWSGRWSDVKIFKGSSLELDPQKVVEACGPSRLFSVDGGHTELCTRNDLEIAEAVSAPYGVVVIDDVFNEFFPEVSMGLQSYIAKGKLRPFAITPNKLYLADPEYAEAYRRHLRERWPNRFEKSCAMFGSEVDLFGIRYASYPAWKKVLRDSPFYPSLRKLKESLEHQG